MLTRKTWDMRFLDEFMLTDKVWIAIQALPYAIKAGKLYLIPHIDLVMKIIPTFLNFTMKGLLLACHVLTQT